MTWTVEQVTARGGARYYRVTNTETGEVKDLWSVTTINKMMPAPALERWKMGKVAAGIAKNDDLRLLALSGDDEAKEAAFQAIDRERSAANRGTAIHKVSESVTTAADAFDIAAELQPVMERFGRMLDDHGIVIKQTEIVLLNFSTGYSGTADRLCLCPVYDPPKMVGDIKTGGVGYFEQAMQLAALANAEYAFVAGELVALPNDINRDYGLVFHVPEAGETADVWELPLADAWEAFQHCAALKHLTSDKDNQGNVGRKVEHTHRFSDTYVEWIRNRLAEHRADNPAIVSMFQAWRMAAYGDRPSADLTTDELEACLTALCDLEAREQVPVPTATYPHPHGPRISAETAEAIQARIDALPQWCRAEVLEQKAKLPSVEAWRVVDAEEFEQVLGPAESAAASLQESIATLYETVDADQWWQVIRAVRVSAVSEWTWTDFDIAGRLVEALADGLLTATRDGMQINPTIVDRLVDKHGSKADATKAIRQRVADLGLDIQVPRSLGDCCTDPVLVALAA